MKRIWLATALAVASTSAWALDVSVGAHITIGDPNFYGVINIGDVPEPPRLIYREPRIVIHEHVVAEPVYMRVPPGHAKHWDKHCHDYGACNRRVFFVEDDWYENRYVPHYKAKHGHGGGGHKSHRGGDHDGGGKHHGGGGKHKGGKDGGKGKGGKGKD
jgi:hypothetical protein